MLYRGARLLGRRDAEPRQQRDVRHGPRPCDGRGKRSEGGGRDAGGDATQETTPAMGLPGRAPRLIHTFDQLPRRRPGAVGVEREPETLDPAIGGESPVAESGRAGRSPATRTP